MDATNAPPVAKKKGNGLAITALVLASFFFLPVIPFFGLVLGIVALVTGRSKPMSIVAICLGAFFTLMTGIYAAVAIPAFMKYIRRSKATEATMNTRVIGNALVAAVGRGVAQARRERLDAADERLRAARESLRRRPGVVGAASRGRASASASTTRSYYQYRVTRETDGWRVEARGDLDCDGIFGHYQRHVTVQRRRTGRVRERARRSRKFRENLAKFLARFFAPRSAPAYKRETCCRSPARGPRGATTGGRFRSPWQSPRALGDAGAAAAAAPAAVALRCGAPWWRGGARFSSPAWAWRWPAPPGPAAGTSPTRATSRCARSTSRRRRTSRAEALVARAAVPIGVNLFAIDRDEVARAVSQEPWVARAHVRRELPSTLVIDVVEREAACAVAFGALYLADADGNVFKRATPDEAASLPVVTGLGRDDYLAQPERAREPSCARRCGAIAAWRVVRRPRAARRGARRSHRRRHRSIPTAASACASASSTTRCRRASAATTRSRAALEEADEAPRLVYVDNRARPDRVTVKLASAPQPAHSGSKISGT